MRGHTTFLTVLLGLIGASEAVAAPALYVDPGGRAVRATPGIACTQFAEADGTPRGECRGRQYPLQTRGQARLTGGQRVDLRFGRSPGQVKWRLLRRPSAQPETVIAGEAFRSPKDPGRFVVQLPRRIPCATILDVYATFGRGDGREDQVWWAGVRVQRRACQKLR